MSAANNNHHLQDNAADTDDTDPESDTAADLESSYRPISFHSDSDSDSDSELEPEPDNAPTQPEPAFQILSNGGGIPNHRQNPNPNFANGISFSSLDLNGRVDEEDEEEGEREREREASILRAFREDESRRNAPLTAENASRVMDAMRGVRFPGSAPDWADPVPEDRWVDRLRRLRGETAATSSQS